MGPVGTLGAPEDGGPYRRFRAVRLEIHVHEDLWEEAREEGELRFHFGRFGLCRIRLPRRLLR